MGASVSSVSLYKVVATVEIVSSTVITVFGINTFLIFQQMDEKFQKDKEMIRYSSIVAVVQSMLTVIASFLLVGCQTHSLPQDEEGLTKGDDAEQRSYQISNIVQRNSFRRKAIAPTWLAWTLVSIASLLFVFIAPIDYCIQTELDRKLLGTNKEYEYDTLDKKMLGRCHTFDESLMPIRSSLRDLYSNSIIGILFKLIFALIVYRNWKHGLKNAKKVVIYVEGCDSNVDEYESDPRAICSSTSTTGVTAPDAGGEQEKKGGVANIVVVVEDLTKK